MDKVKEPRLPQPDCEILGIAGPWFVLRYLVAVGFGTADAGSRRRKGSFGAETS